MSNGKNATPTKAPESRAQNWVNVSEFGTPWKPKKSGEELIGVIQNHEWAGTGKDAFPVCNVINATTGELFALRFDTAMLRVLGKIPVESKIRIVYKGTKKGKGNPMKIFEVFTDGKVKLGENFVDIVPMPETKTKTKARKAKRTVKNG